MSERLTLDYRLPKGRLTPFFEALQRGEALASVCEACGFAHFPPALACTRCGSAAFAWRRLSGAASILQRTDTPEQAFALVRFAGADNAALVRLVARERKSSSGILVAAADEAPGLTVALTAAAPNEKEENDV